MEKLWNRNYCKVMVANFTLFFAFYVLTPLLPLYLSEHFGATKDVIGLVLSGYTITALLFRPFSGYVVDAFPRKKVLMVAFGAFAIFFAGYLAASTLLLFTIVRTLHGGPFGALTVSNSTVAIDVLPSSRRTEGIGYYGLSNNLAMAIAPSVGIFIYQLTGSFGAVADHCMHCLDHELEHAETETQLWQHDALQFSAKCCCDDFDSKIQFTDNFVFSLEKQLVISLQSFVLPHLDLNEVLVQVRQIFDNHSSKKALKFLSGQERIVFFSSLKINPLVF